MDVTRELTLALLSTQKKNARIYEYLLGALLQAEDRTRHLDDMIEYKKKVKTFLDDIDSHSSERRSQLDDEVALNKELIQAVRSCEQELWVNHGYGLPVKRCSSKWIYQDFPNMLSHSRVVNEPLHVLCRHVRDKYDATKDPVIKKLLDRIKDIPGKSQSDSCDQPAASPSNDKLDSPADPADPADLSDDDGALVVEEAAKYPLVARDSGQDENCTGKATECPDTNKLVLAAKNAGDIASWEKRVQHLRAEVAKSLEQLNPTLCPSANKHLQEDAVVKMTTVQDTKETADDTSIYMPRSLRSSPTMALAPSKLNAVILKYVIQGKPGFISRRHLARPLPVVEMAAGTPLDPEYGTSPCGIRASRMTPLRAPIKKDKHSTVEFHYEEVREDVPEKVLSPYVKPLFRPRVSHVTQHMPESVEDRDRKWRDFQTHLEAVRQRVMNRLKEKEVDAKCERSGTKQKKQKRRKNKSRCRRKCKKHARTSGDAHKTPSSVTLPCKTDTGGDVKEIGDVNSPDERQSANASILAIEVHSVCKEKKRKRRHKKKRASSNSCSHISEGT